MKPRVASQLADYGCQISVDDFRTALREIKAELYPGLTDENLAFTRHEAERYCAAVRERVGGKRLSRVFILTNLVNLRKNGKRGKVVSPPVSGVS